MAILTVNCPVVSFLPHIILVLVTVDANGGTGKLHGQACPQLSIFLGVSLMETKIDQSSWNRDYSESNKNEQKQGYYQ